METLRDTAFGKLVRLATRYKWMQYPEEKDPSVWTEYLKTEVKEEDTPSTAQTENESPQDLEACGIYTVMSQVSTRTRRMSSASTIGAPDQSIVISWRGPDDPEVSRVNDSSEFQGPCTNIDRPEPAKLDHEEEILRQFLDLAINLRHIHRLCNLHTWYSWCLRAIRREQCRWNSRTNTLRTRLWTRFVTSTLAVLMHET